MKRTIHLILIIGLSLIFTYCSNNQKPAEEQQKDTEQTQIEEKQNKEEPEVITDTTASEQTAENEAAQELTANEPEAVPAEKEEPAKQEPPVLDKQVKILIKTSMGNITAVLYNETPKHRDNFIKNIKDGWYENSPWHRIIANFMIQGGQNADGRVDRGYTIPAEFRPQFFHKKGALAAARQPDEVNPQMASSSCQFYIVQGQVLNTEQLNMFAQRYNLNLTKEQIKAYTTIGGSPHLDGTYTIFGEVTEGLDVVDKLAAVKTGPGAKPVENISMTIEIIED